jgi:hypothetical protein
MAIRDFTNNSIPYLGPYHATAQYNEKGQCVLPSSLVYQCELSYALDHDFSALRYVKRHIRAHGFGHKGGHFHNAYDAVKRDKAFAHEMVHLWLNIWGTTDSYVPLRYKPFYDGNGQAEALVIPMQDIIARIQNGDRELPNKTAYKRNVDWSHQDAISRYQQSWNDAAIIQQRTGKNIPVYDWLRQCSVTDWKKANNADNLYASEEEMVTDLGERLSDPLNGKELSVPDEASDNFFNACQPLLESLILTIDDVQKTIGKGERPLSSRTIDMMFRTLKVREVYDVMRSGQPRVLGVNGLNRLRRIEEGLLAQYDAGQIKTNRPAPAL